MNHDMTIGNILLFVEAVEAFLILAVLSSIA